MIKVAMASLGCPKNQVDGEMLLATLKEAGFDITNDEFEAEVIIVNTCGFIGDAKKESIDTILELAKLKETANLKCLVVTGCLAERYQSSILEEIPEVDVVLGIGTNSDIANAICEFLENNNKVEHFADKLCLALEGKRVLSTPPHYAYLKIAEGCDNHCSYCAIPSIRGRFRSREMQNIIDEATHLAKSGVKELIVVAQDTTRYGEDLYKKPMLSTLLRELCKIDGLVWIRVLYCYPERITDELIEVMRDEPKICKYIDIPLQHISDDILRAMNRKSTSATIKTVLCKLRNNIPNITIRTTFIAGFPNESEENFDELCDFVKEQKFERLGCFAYSPEEDTKAATMSNQLDEETKRYRAEIIMREQQLILDEKNEARIGTTDTAVIEAFIPEENLYLVRTQSDAPEIDTLICIKSYEPLDIGCFYEIEITELSDFELYATAVKRVL